MRKTLTVRREEPVLVGSEVEASALLERSEGTRSRLWYRLPRCSAESLTDFDDPFAIGAVTLALWEGRDLHIEGPVSSSLLSNLERYRSCWVRWRPDRFYQIKITASNSPEEGLAPPPRQAIMAFSGGVDSCFTALTLAHGSDPSTPGAHAAIMVQGFDIPLTGEEIFRRASQNAEQVLQSIDLPLIRMSSNFREFDQRWNFVFPTGLASCLSLLQRNYGEGVVASGLGVAVGEFRTSPAPTEIAAPLLSSVRFRIVDHGTAFGRIDKLRALSAWPEAMQNLRVCWEGRQLDANCGKCEKCIRTILSIRVLGVDLPSCFPVDVTDKEIGRLRVPRNNLEAEFVPILDLADQNSIQEPWVEAIRSCISRNRRWHRLKSLRPWRKRL